jgi:hypothetical protein
VLIEGTVAVATPLPLTATAVGALLALLPKVIVPLAFPVAVGANDTLTDTLCPAARLIGKVGPLAVNAATDDDNEDSVTAVPPVFVTDTLWDEVLPMLTLPIFRAVGFAVIAPAVWAGVPVPLTATAVGALLALLPKTIAPLAFPVAVGANATLTDTLCPAARLIGKVGPLAVNAAADDVNEDSVTAVPPVFVTDTVCDEVLPTLTLPIFRAAGFAVIAPAVWAGVPVPLTATAVGALLALLPTVITPFAVPVVVGVNAT